MNHPNCENIDKVLKCHFDLYPNYDNYFDIVYQFHFNDTEEAEILEFLIRENLIENKIDERYIITKKGREIYTLHGSVKEYLEKCEKNQIEENIIEKAKNEKIIYDARLTKWKAQTFWFFFWISIAGTFFSIYSVINKITEEPIEQKIQRLIKENISTHQNGNATLKNKTNDNSISDKKLIKEKE